MNLNKFINSISFLLFTGDKHFFHVFQLKRKKHCFNCGNLMSNNDDIDVSTVSSSITYQHGLLP